MTAPAIEQPDTDEAQTPRCPWTVRWGLTAEHTTQCDRPEHVWNVHILPAGDRGKYRVEYQGDPSHSGPSGVHRGQVVTWQTGDRREYTGMWPGACRFPRCVLPAGHHGRCAL